MIIIDDDACNNLIFKIIITCLCKPYFADIQDFTNPVSGLAHLEALLPETDENIVLFLDINMPEMSGWEVLDAIMKMPEACKDLLTIYMFSSSLNVADKQRALNCSLVKGYVEKPLTAEMIWLKKDLIIDSVVYC